MGHHVECQSLTLRRACGPGGRGTHNGKEVLVQLVAFETGVGFVEGANVFAEVLLA